MIEGLIDRSLLSAMHGRSPIPVSDPGMVRTLAGITTVLCVSVEMLYGSDPFVSQYFAVQDQTFETKRKVLQIAGSLGVHVKSAYFQAVAQATQESGLPLREVEVDMVKGGVEAQIEKTRYLFGEERLMKEEGIDLGTTGTTISQQFETSGKQMLYLAQKQPKRLLAIFACDQGVAFEAVDAIAKMQGLGLEIALLTQQNTRTAKALALQLGISTVHSELRDEAKRNLVASLQKSPGTAVLCDSDTLAEIAPVKLPLIVGDPQSSESGLVFPTMAGIPESIRVARAAVEQTKKRFFWHKFTS